MSLCLRRVLALEPGFKCSLMLCMLERLQICLSFRRDAAHRVPSGAAAYLCGSAAQGEQVWHASSI